MLLDYTEIVLTEIGSYELGVYVRLTNTAIIVSYFPFDGLLHVEPDIENNIINLHFESGFEILLFALIQKNKSVLFVRTDDLDYILDLRPTTEWRESYINRSPNIPRRTSDTHLDSANLRKYKIKQFTCKPKGIENFWTCEVHFENSEFIFQYHILDELKIA